MKSYVIVRLSYDYRSTVVRLSYDVVTFTHDLASHQAIIVKSYVIVRLSFDCRTISHDLPTIAQTLPMCRKPIVFRVTTKLKLIAHRRRPTVFRLFALTPIVKWTGENASSLGFTIVLNVKKSLTDTKKRLDGGGVQLA